MSEIPTISDIERISPKFYISDTGCWVWTASKNNRGYATFKLRGVGVNTHRVTYAMFYGDVPAGLHIDHLCRTRNCVNPQHMEAVTHAENMRRAAPHNRKTHCKRGHEYTEGNTRLIKYQKGKTTLGFHRNCRTCSREKNSQRWYTEKALRADGVLQTP